LKTLHLTNAWCSISGGIATFYRALFDAANQRGHEMRLVVPGDADCTEERGDRGRIYYVKAPRAPFNGGYRLILPHRYLLPGSRVQRIVADEAPDVVEVCDKYTLNWLAGLLRVGGILGVKKKPAVIGLSCERLDDSFRAYIGSASVADWFCRAYMQWFYFPLFDHHIAVSHHTAGELRAASTGHKVRRGVWIRPMGVDVKYLSPSRRNSEFRRGLLQATGGDERTVLLLYVGRLAAEKNLGLPLATMRDLAGDPEYDYRLIVAGSGSLRDELEREAREVAPARVTFLGHIGDREWLADLFANADVFLHPNPREPFGIAPLEAMTSGLPLVAPATGGVSAYANGGNCWFADPEPAAFAAAVRAIHANPVARARRVTAARATAERFAWPRVCSAILDLYAEIHAAATEDRGEWLLPPDFFSTGHRTRGGGIGGSLGRDNAQILPRVECRGDSAAARE
jgi:alpha-1,6-mannosyltransferase